MKQRAAFKCLVLFAILFSLGACLPRNLPLSTPTSSAATPEVTPSPSAEPDLQISPSAAPSPTGSPIAHMTSGETIVVTTIRMVTVSTGWAIGGKDGRSDHVFWTDDGGLTWYDVTPPQPAPPADQPISALGFFKTINSGWVVYGPEGYGSIPETAYVWYTHDAGQTWKFGTVDTSVSNESFSPWYLTFADDQHGWLMVLLGGGMNHAYVAIFTTSDGGVAWEKILDPYSDGGIQSFSKTDMVFMDAKTGWLTRDSYGVEAGSAHVLRTLDGGVTWNRISLPAPVSVPNLFTDYACGTYSANRFSTTSAIFALKCEDFATFKNQLNFQYTTTDGGKTWQTFQLPAGYLINAPNDGLLYFDPNYGFALGRSIYQTTDGGASWTLIKQVTWDGQFSFVSMNMGWAVARGENSIALVKTSTGGSKWEIINPYVVP